jgi:hypothetical protein
LAAQLLYDVPVADCPMTTVQSSFRGTSRWQRLVVSLAARALKFSLGLGTVLLVGFHLVLLAGDVAGGHLLDPAVAMQWLAAAALAGVLLAFRYVGVPLLWGRRAAVLWLLVLVLHGVAQPPAGEHESASLPDPAGGLTLLFLPVVATGLAAVALARPRYAAARLARSAAQPLPAPPAISHPSLGFTLLLAPRPPPIA